jgi:hypothetical protein
MTSLTRLLGLTLAGLGLCAASAHGGLHLSQERYAAFPTQWKGFLLDHRALRMAAVPAGPGGSPGLLRESYTDAVTALRATAQTRALTADELADWGGLLIRLGEPQSALQVLRPAARQFPDHFRILANLGTAWQVAGDLPQSAAALEQAVRLAPPELRPLEQLHLKLVRLRLREPKGADGLDDLFGLRTDRPTVRLPVQDAANLQRLALTLPADARLLWQLAEVAYAFGEVRTAAAMADGCVSEFALANPQLRQRRRVWREAVAAAEAKGHDGHPRSQWPAKSNRPLIRQIDSAILPAIRPEGVNDLPWAVINLTTVERPFRPVFADYLVQLDGKRVSLIGTVQADGSDEGSGSFLLIEYPVGCWFCEAPDVTNIVQVQLAGEQPAAQRSGVVRVEGVLELNRTSPEDFLLAIRDARLRPVD